MNEFLNINFEIPKWNENEINSLEFQGKFISNFLNEIYIDLKGENTYLFKLMDYLFMEYVYKKELKKSVDYFQNLMQNYEFSIPYVEDYLAQIYTFEKDFENAWKYSKQNPQIEKTCFFYFKLKRDILDGKLIYKMVRKSTIRLSDFGKKNIQDIIPHISDVYEMYRKDHDDHIFEMKKYLIKKPCVIHSLKYYDSTISKDPIFHDLNYSVYEPSKNNKIDLIEDLFNEFIYEAENKFRISRNLPKIGEGWISETELFYTLKEYFHKETVVHHGKPIWLGKQHLDIYFPKYNIGIEYQGEQHYKPIKIFGGEEGFKKNLKRDEEKRTKCYNNKCELIYVNKNFKINELVEIIESTITRKK